MEHAYYNGLIDNTGDNFTSSKLTWVKVKEIRQLYATGNYLQRELAVQFSVGITTISAIIRYKTWKIE